MRGLTGSPGASIVAALCALSSVGASAGSRPACPPVTAPRAPLDVAPFVADISRDHAVVRWVDGNPGSEGLVSPKGVVLREHVRVLAGGGGWVHTAMTPLVGLSTLELFVECGRWSSHAVRVTPAPGPGTPLTFVAMGDNRSNDGDHASVVASIDALGPDVVVNTGDMVLTGAPEHWTRFFEIERNLLRRTPLFASFGNHEVIDRPDIYDALVSCPRPGPKGSRACVRDYGDLRVVHIDTEGEHASQQKWLAAVLAEPAAPGVRRVEIVAMHRPVYTFSRHAPDLRWRSVLHPIAVDADVEIVFQGHNHTYERFEVDGVQYVTTGGGGAPRYPADYAVRPEEAHLRRKGRSVLHYVVGRVSGGQIEVEVVEPGADSLIDKFVAR